MSRLDEPVGVALIGAGMIATTHIAALSEMTDLARLGAIVARSAERAQPLATLYSGDAPLVTSKIAAVAQDPTIAFAIVATPPNVRHDVIAPLVAAGKHILLEKPVARNLPDSQEIVALCDRAKVTLGMVFQHRARAPAIAARQLIAKGGLGALGLVEIDVPLWRDQSYYDERGRGTYARDGGGVLLTNAIHSIDLVTSLVGPVTRVQAMTATTRLHRMEAEDFAVAGLHFTNGAVGSFTASTAMFPHRTEVIRLHYEQASLRIDKDSLQIDWRDGRHETVGNPATTTAQVPLAGGKHQWHRAVIADFVTAITTNAKPMVTGQEALASHQIITAIERSSDTGQAIDLPPVV